jgi:hypothetical protein
MGFPSMDALIDLKSEGQIIGGGVPAGERALVLIFDAESNEGLDTILRRLSLWGWQSGNNSAREPQDRASRDHHSLSNWSRICRDKKHLVPVTDRAARRRRPRSTPSRGAGSGRRCVLSSFCVRPCCWVRGHVWGHGWPSTNSAAAESPQLAQRLCAISTTTGTASTYCGGQWSTPTVTLIGGRLEMGLVELRRIYRCVRQGCSARMGLLASRFPTLQQRLGVNRAFPGTRAVQVRLSSAEEQHG